MILCQVYSETGTRVFPMVKQRGSKRMIFTGQENPDLVRLEAQIVLNVLCVCL